MLIDTFYGGLRLILPSEEWFFRLFYVTAIIHKKEVNSEMMVPQQSI